MSKQAGVKKERKESVVDSKRKENSLTDEINGISNGITEHEFKASLKDLINIRTGDGILCSLSKPSLEGSVSFHLNCQGEFFMGSTL